MLGGYSHSLQNASAASYPLNEWVTVEIPLSAFMGTRGTWSDKDQKWYDLPCDFTWSRFESLYFDFDDFNGMKKGDIYIDDIVIKMK